MKPSIWNSIRCGGGLPKRGSRSVYQQDYDRVLFSTPVRRLADKTQVFPLDKNDSVRTRLTHSHEVANLARSIGQRLVHDGLDFGAPDEVERSALPILSTIGLAHDLGNPPFGHRGEAAIQDWFQRNRWVFDKQSFGSSEHLVDQVDPDLYDEFLKFDGNPQTLRLLTKLQTSPAKVGLDLSVATLAASLKYSVGVRRVDESKASAKKFGYFESEKALVGFVRKHTGLIEGERHPLTWIMEACDDIAYSVLDVEDSIKKNIISPDDILIILSRFCRGELTYRLQDRFGRAENTERPAPIVRDMKAGYFRASAIDALVEHAAAEYLANEEAINAKTHARGLMDNSALCKALKGIAKQYAFGNTVVLKSEAEGAKAISFLMDCFWSAIVNRDGENLDSSRANANDRHLFSLISPNYIDAACDSEPEGSKPLPLRYRELRLLTDMVSGMTDTFCVELANQLRPLYQ